MPAQKVGPKIGMYIGKFQPFHNGHLSAIKYILTQVNQLVIVIGSSQYANEKDQPFSAEQRQQMIEQTLAAEDIQNYSIVLVPDIHDHEHWVQHVQTFVKHFDIVFTNNELVAKLFQAKGFQVQPIPFLPNVSGTLIREKLASEEIGWVDLVPQATAQLLKSKLF